MTAGVALTLPVVGAELTEKQAKSAVEYRQSLFELVKSNIGPLGAMAKGKAPIDEAVIAKNALRLEQLGLMISDYFVADTQTTKYQTSRLMLFGRIKLTLIIKQQIL